MGHIKRQPDHSPWGRDPDWPDHPFTTIVVAALPNNRRPVGFAPWPVEEPKKKK